MDDGAEEAMGVPLAPDLIGRLSALLAVHPRAPSEYSAANLLLYRHRHHYRLIEGPLPHLLGLTYGGVRHALPLAPVGAGDVGHLLRAADCLYPLAADEAGALAQATGGRIDWLPADADYLYEAARLAVLGGAKAKRAQARAFAVAQAPHLVGLDAAGPDLALAVLDGWLADVGRAPAATDYHECREALAWRAALRLEGWMAVLGSGEPVAFLLAGPEVAGTRIVHFAKGRRAHAGAYPWLFAQFAAVCGAARLNFEQDLGNPGFAQAKRALAPAGQLRKYRLWPAGGA